jgi:hypothetical protein
LIPVEILAAANLRAVFGIGNNPEMKRRLFKSCGNPVLRMIITPFFLAVLSFGVPATTIVAVKTGKEIVIGADSKVTDTFGNAAANQACKIVQAGNVFFAYTGFARDTRTGLSIPQIASEALNLQPELSIAEKTRLLSERVVEKLNTELPLLKQNNWAGYREKIEGRIFLRILVAGFEKNKPVILVRQFRLGQTDGQTAGVIVSADDCDAKCKGKNVTRYLGETDAIDGLPEETPGFWKAGLSAGVRKLVETEIAARDEYVGGPVDILQITAKTAVWIQKKAGVSGYPKLSES